MKLFFIKLWMFTLNPKNSYNYINISTKNKISDTYKAIVIYYALALLAFIPVTGLIKIIEYFFSIDIFKIRDNNINKTLVDNYSLILLILIGPIIEETVFRLWLSLKKIPIIISLIAILWVVVTKYNNISIYSTVNKTSFYNLFIAAILGFIVFNILNISFIKKILIKNYKLIYWCSCVGFGLIHLSNFAPINLNIIWAYPFFILPQLIFGFVLAYVRIKNGFFWALLLHCLINLPGTLHYFKQ